MAELDDAGGCEHARDAVASVAGVEQVDLHGTELTVRTADGAAAVSPVAVALSGAGVHVRSLTLRTPSLDDVFLELTGGHLQQGEPVEEVA